LSLTTKKLGYSNIKKENEVWFLFLCNILKEWFCDIKIETRILGNWDMHIGFLGHGIAFWDRVVWMGFGWVLKHKITHVLVNVSYFYQLFLVSFILWVLVIILCLNLSLTNECCYFCGFARSIQIST
jgi:hypothetical protein